MCRRTLCAVISLSLCVHVSSHSVSVSTSYGDVIGQQHDGYNTFYGVPYAQVDETNPFGKSLDHPKFKTPFIANDSSIMCPQVNKVVGGTLQCLRLNIYVPQTVNANNKLPILVWFYGGGFVMGYAGLYGGQHLVKHDIIVVTVNYRLGPYGFFCLDDPSVPGNQGLKDQITALKWIKENIGDFGGDADKVTIAGESYGGGAVDLHLYSKSETLFDKAIIESGSIFNEGFFVKPDYKSAVKIANYLGHNVTSTKRALKVLSQQNPLDVMGATRNLSLSLMVCKEKHFRGVQNFVDKDPFHLNNPARVKNTPTLVGYNSKETFRMFANQPKEFYDELGDIFYSDLKNNFVLSEHEMRDLSNIIRRYYLGAKQIGPESMLELTDYTADFIGNHAAESSVNRYIEQGASVYKYLFSYIGGSEYKNISGVGAVHAEELDYLFEMDRQLKTEEQVMMRDRMTTMWSQFVKFGNPTPRKTALLPVTWTPVKDTARPYLNIDVEMTMRDHVYQHRIAFWDLFWHTYAKRSIVFDRK